jgi:hypothetical protein
MASNQIHRSAFTEAVNSETVDLAQKFSIAPSGWSSCGTLGHKVRAVDREPTWVDDESNLWVIRSFTPSHSTWPTAPPGEFPPRADRPG